jgi:hypothetical protein
MADRRHFAIGVDAGPGVDLAQPMLDDRRSLRSMARPA